MTNDAPISLPRIYLRLADEKLARAHKGRIVAQQYDDFIALWKRCREYECIVGNCRHQRTTQIANPALLGGGVLLPRQNCSQGTSVEDDENSEARCKAIADSIGELIWNFVSEFSLLPVLEIATPLDEIDQEKLNSLRQPWISLYFATCGAYFLTVEKAGFSIGPVDETGPPELVGWFDDLLIARYVPSKDAMGSASVPHANWVAYSATGDGPIKLPAYFYHVEYFTQHNGEIVAGYDRKGEQWKLQVLNGLPHNADAGIDSIETLFGGSPTGFDKVVRKNISEFRPWFIGKKIDPRLLSNCDERHTEARKAHFRLLGDVKPDYAITLTHNLVTVPFEESSVNPQQRQAASIFTNFLITVPSDSRSKLTNTEQIVNLQEMVTALWDNIDILKLPISRQMTVEAERRWKFAEDELQANLRETQIYSNMYKLVQRPLNHLLELTRDLTNTAGKLSLIRGDHLQSLHAQRYQLAMLFEDGNPDRSSRKFKGPGHNAGNYDSYNDFAAALLRVILTIAIGKVDESMHVDSNGVPAAEKLKYELDRLMSEARKTNTAISAAFSIMAPRDMWDGNGITAGKVAQALIESLKKEWDIVKIDDYETKPGGSTPDPYTPSNRCPTSAAALVSLKRRVHSNFKPSLVSLFGQERDKATTLDDLVCLLDDSCFMTSTPALSSCGDLNELVLFHPESFPFRSVGDFFTALHMFFKGKKVVPGKGMVSFIHNPNCKSICIKALLKDGKKDAYFIDPNRMDRTSELLNALVDENHAAGDGLILGDYLSPLIALLRGAASRPSPISVVDRGGDVGKMLVFKFENRTASFEWLIGPTRMDIASRRGSK